MEQANSKKYFLALVMRLLGIYIDDDRLVGGRAVWPVANLINNLQS